MKKVLLSVLVLAAIFMMIYSVQAGETIKTYIAKADFYDVEPSLTHNNPRVDTVISCTMVVKPKTQAHLSLLCSSAVSNVMFYFNSSENNIQKGPDYNNTVEDEVFYPTTGRIADSYIGGTVSYKVAADFQTKKSDGEKIHLEIPEDNYQTAVIISSKTVYLNAKEDYTLSQPTGDQSKPNWTKTRIGNYNLSVAVYINYTFRFGNYGSNASGVSAPLKVKYKKVAVVNAVCASALDITEEEIAVLEGAGVPVIDGVVYGDGIVSQPLEPEEIEKLRKAKKLVMQYNLNKNACDEFNNVLTEDGWKDIPESQAQYLKITSTGIEYPGFMNAWGRIYAVFEVPTADDCKPVRRTIVKGRIGSKYPGFEFKNMKEGDVLKIYNVNGKKIREITSGTAEGFVWDGRNDNGDWAKSGIYIYQLKVDGKLINGTIVFVY